MKPISSLIFLWVAGSLMAFGQRSSIKLSFTAVDNAAWQQLDSIKVMNRTQGGDTVLYYPDTVLVLSGSFGIPDIGNGTQGLAITRVYPNPSKDYSTIEIQLPGGGEVAITATDILGRVVVRAERFLEKGHHSFRFIPGAPGTYLVKVEWNGERQTFKVLNSSSALKMQPELEYIGSVSEMPSKKVMKEHQGFPISKEDTLLFIGYANSLESGILNAPSESQGFTFQFAYDIPCPGTPTVTYEGQVYNTVQIFSQCWLKENLNVGMMIPGNQDQTDNDVIEKYCYDNEAESCTKYGGLYQWNEMMQYTTRSGTQGICPSGWHLPTDDEWKVLEGVADSYYIVGGITWEGIGYRGFDAGTNLKTTNGWEDWGNGTDVFGFSGLPGGGRYLDPSFAFVGSIGDWWSSSRCRSVWSNDAVCRCLENSNSVHRCEYNEYCGFSVRCLRDETYMSREVGGR